MVLIRTAAAAAMLTLSSVAFAGEIKAVPIDSENVTMRYVRGVPTAQIDDGLSTVNITPLGNDHNKLRFAVTFFNKGQQPANFGIENVRATLGGNPHVVLDKDQLVRIAKKREGWKMAAVAMAGGLAAASAAANAGRSEYNSTMVAPSGRVYRYNATYVNHTERALVTGAAAAGTAYAVSQIQNGLDEITANLNGEILQTTTVDPGSGYGGLVMIDKLKAKGAYDLPLNLIVSVNGRDYAFQFDPQNQ